MTMRVTKATTTEATLKARAAALRLISTERPPRTEEEDMLLYFACRKSLC
jgi:hypothetical protein